MIKVRQEILILLSGLIWTIIGVLLNFMAIGWLIYFESLEKILTVTIGLILGASITYFGFNRIVKINTDRISKYEGKACIFAFQSWKSYAIFAVMVTMGFFMRTTGVIPKLILTPLYIGIGLALLISSIKYYRIYLVLKRTRKLKIPL